jgi:N-acetyl-gamma-glutamyl-phosphate reductase
MNKPKVAIIGASGYAGAELSALVAKHPNLELYGLYVSGSSKDAHKNFSDLYPMYHGVVDKDIIPLSDDNAALDDIKKNADIVCLCTAHDVSMRIAPDFITDDSKRVFDLSGAYRVNDPAFYEKYYGFTHTRLDWLESAVYGLGEWNDKAIRNAKLVAVAGCYPTASLTALKPLFNAGLIREDSMPIINAVSGVSGSGRKASLTSSFCEVSLNPYGVFTHRHRPEISHHLGQKVLFQPHLGNFKRGILATIYVQLKDGVTDEQIAQAYKTAYEGRKLVRILSQWPSIRSVAYTPYVDLHWQREDNTLIVGSAIDNLIKGAAGQALQCININCGYDETLGLI